MRTIEVVVEPDYGQFYLCRAGAAWASDAVPSDGYERSLWSNGSFVYVGTDRKWGSTPLRIDVLDRAPASLPDGRWQHVAEISLDPGGDLEVYDWPGDVPTVVVPLDPGPVRARLHWTGLVPNRFEGMDADGNSDEALRMQVWPAPTAEPTVLRWWEQWVLPAPTNRSPDGRRQTEGLEAVIERLPVVEVVARMPHPYPAMPGGGEHSTVHAVMTDPVDGSWWVDGYDVRRTLREVTPAEAEALIDPPP
jgi:hypothetical protein